MTYDVTLIPGDGIGPEITTQTVKVLKATGLRFNWDEELAGVAAVEATGTPLPDATVESIRKNALALKGPLTTPVGTGFRSVNVGLRKEFELFANIRPARTILPGGRFENVDIVLVRENLEGLYVGVEHFIAVGDDPRAVAESMAIVPRRGCERIIRYAFELARKNGQKHVTLVDKANAIPIQEIWREVFEELGKEFADVRRDAMYVDAAAMWMVLKPEQFDVVVTTNLFGDILSDLGAALAGGLGTASSGNINPGKVSVFEPIHGSAPKYAGKGVASPIAAIGALALLLDHLGEHDAAKAVDTAIRKGLRSGQIKGVEAGIQPTNEVAELVAKAVAG